MTRKTVVIAFFNNKGGVSKTTTCFHVGWKLADMGKSVVMVDLDPQCNLSGLALEISNERNFEDVARDMKGRNVYDSLRPAMKSLGEKITSPECLEVSGNSKLRILLGNVKMAEVETQLATAMNMGSILPAIQNVPGSFDELYKQIGERYDADFLLLDMSPSLGALNQVNLFNSDFFIVPMMPDIFSVMAISSLARVLPDWKKWAEKVKMLNLFDDEDLVYKFNPRIPKFLGTVIQRYNLRRGMPTSSFSKYIQELEEAISSTLVPGLAGAGMLEDSIENEASATNLAMIPDFNSLIAAAQTNRKPVFKLEENDLSTGGAAAEGQLENIRKFDQIFEQMASAIIDRTQVH